MREFRGKVHLDDCRIVEVRGSGGVKVYIGDGDSPRCGRHVWLYEAMIDDDSPIYRAGQSGELVVSEKVALAKELI